MGPKQVPLHLVKEDKVVMILYISQSSRTGASPSDAADQAEK